MGAASDHRSSRSLIAALCLLGGLVAGQAAPCPRVGWACALLGVGLAAGERWRLRLVPAGIGLLLAWLQPGLAATLPVSVAATRPVTATVRQAGAWQEAIEGWQIEVRVETLRQGMTVERWPAVVRLYSPRRLPGSRWRLRGRLSRGAGLANGTAARPAPWRLAVKSARLTEALADPRPAAPAMGLLRRWRAEIAQRARRAGRGSPGTALARALVLGEARALPEPWLRGLRRTGLAHVTALSGLHLGVLAAWCALVARRAPPLWRWGLVAGVTLAYLGLGGARPSLARSWLMVAAAAAAALSRRPGRSLHALSWTAAGLGALTPPAVLELGFQLTFAASAGVIVGARSLPPAWKGWRRRLAAVVAPTMGAQLATAPLSLGAFSWLPLWAWCWNLALVPVVALAVPLSFVWLLVILVAPSGAGPLRWLLDRGAGLIALPADLPAWFLGGVPWGQGAFAALLAAAVGALVWRCPRRAAALVAALLLAGGAGGVGGREEAALRMLDVGQGDSLLLRDAGGFLIVDGGGGRSPGIAERALLPALGRLGVRRLEAAVLSHGDRDHCQGLLELAGYLELGEIWLAPAAAGSECGRRLLLLGGVRLRPLWAGQEVRWRGWRFEVLSPLPGARGGNEQSLVLRGERRGRSLMLTGDIGHRTEFQILQRTAPESLRSDVLKVAHHGSGGSSSLSFLRAVDPVLALASAGRDNPFGQPSRRVVERFAALGIPLLRTDLAGQIGVSWSAGRPLAITMPGPLKQPVQ